MKILKNKESDDLDGKYIRSGSETWTQFYKIFDIRNCQDTHTYVGFCNHNRRIKECPRNEKKYVILLDGNKAEYPYCYYHNWLIKDSD